MAELESNCLFNFDSNKFSKDLRDKADKIDLDIKGFIGNADSTKAGRNAAIKMFNLFLKALSSDKSTYLCYTSNSFLITSQIMSFMK